MKPSLWLLILLLMKMLLIGLIIVVCFLSLFTELRVVAGLVANYYILARVNIATGQCLIQAYPKGNGEHTIQYLKYLMSQYNDKRRALIWDGAKYHYSAEVKDFLSVVNNG
jgi:hypothetical protein